jgi:hypothetical protein
VALQSEGSTKLLDGEFFRAGPRAHYKESPSPDKLHIIKLLGGYTDGLIFHPKTIRTRRQGHRIEFPARLSALLATFAVGH